MAPYFSKWARCTGPPPTKQQASSSGFMSKKLRKQSKVECVGTELHQMESFHQLSVSITREIRLLDKLAHKVLLVVGLHPTVKVSLVFWRRRRLKQLVKLALRHYLSAVVNVECQSVSSRPVWSFGSTHHRCRGQHRSFFLDAVKCSNFKSEDLWRVWRNP